MLTATRQTLRAVLRTPGVTALIIVTLSLGIGATTTLFSVLDSVLWRPLPFAESDRLVSVLEGAPGDDNPTSPACYLALREASSSLRDLTATYMWNPVLRDREHPSEVRGLRTTPELFELLRSRAELGRVFTPESGEEPRSDDERMVVLSHGLWQERFGGDRGIVGTSLSLDGEPYIVAGVMPPDFAFPTFWATGAQLWASFIMPPAASESDSRFLRVFGRLAPGIELEAAQAEADLLAKRLVRADPQGNEGLSFQVSPLKEPTVARVRTAFWILFGMVGLLLSVACANVASLFLARTSSRRRELAVRLALGASRGRLVRRLLGESLLLALVGGVGGLLMSLWAIEALVAFGPEQIPRLAEIELDQRGLLFALLVTMMTGLAFGMAPALGCSARSLSHALHGGSRTVGLRPGDRLRRGLVVAEVTMTVLLLVAAGLLVRSFDHLSRLDPGFQRQDVLTLQLSLRGTPHAEPERQHPFFEAALDAVRHLPGVEHAGLMNHLPVGDDIWTHSLTVIGREPPAPGETPKATVRVASPGLFRTLDIELLSGELFAAGLDAEGPRQTVVNRTFAERYFPGEDPVGRQLRRGGADSEGPVWTIVGVVEDIRQWRLTDDVRPEMIFPYAQNPLSFWPKASLVVRTAVEPLSLATRVKDRLWRLAPDVAVSNVRTMESLLADSIAEIRFQTLVLSCFALLAVILAAVGVYGVMSYLVAWRRADIGVRMALGADRGRILRWVVGSGLRLAALGVGCGLLLAWALRDTMSSLLHGVEPGDGATFAVATLGLLGIALVAILLPAWAATRVDPLTCLRSE